MLRKTLEIGTPGTRLSVALRQLVIDRPDQPRATVPIEDIGVLIVDDGRASYTQAVFTHLVEAGAIVLITGPNHLPMGMMLPIEGHHVQAERQRAQVAASVPVRKRVWQALVAAKLLQQGRVLDRFGIERHSLAAMAQRVRSGDPDNLEAQGAQRYWPLLFGKDFRRDRDAGGVNAALNYGYAIVRASVARAIVGSGLIPSLGVFHKNRANAFCLADDLFEPYRPIVDWRVKLLTQEQAGPLLLDERPVRAALLSVLNEGIRVGERTLPLLLAVEAGAASLARALMTGEVSLALPDSLPTEGETHPDASSDD